MNRVRLRRRTLRDLLRIDSHDHFHDYLFRHAIDRYRAHLCGDVGNSRAESDLGRVLAIGANHRDALALAKLPFEQILLTGIADPDDSMQNALDGDSRISYRIENSEQLALESRSFDLVFCKESLHHLARPVLGLYEMLRVCRRAALLIEPYDTTSGRFFERLGLSTVYETHQAGNLGARDNFVYRFGRRPLEFLLNSYYLESNYTLEITLGWMSSRLNAHPLTGVRRLAALAGWGLGFVPGSRGNYMTALILPGRDLPPDPIAAEDKPIDAP